MKCNWHFCSLFSCWVVGQQDRNNPPTPQPPTADVKVEKVAGEHPENATAGGDIGDEYCNM